MLLDLDRFLTLSISDAITALETSLPLAKCSGRFLFSLTSRMFFLLGIALTVRSGTEAECASLFNIGEGFITAKGV